LVIGFALMASLQLLNIGARGNLNLHWLRFDLGTFFLVSLLPLIGSLHFERLSRPQVQVV
jgi:hypothetical protein